MNEHLTYHSEIEYWKDVYKNKIKFVSTKDATAIPWDIKDVDPNLKEILDSFNLFNGDLLELGCGTGYDANYLSKRGFKVEAIDVSEEAIEIAKQNNKNLNINFIVDDFFSGFPTKKYDIIYDRGFSHNYKDRLFEIFEKVSDSLNENGKFIIIGGNPNQPPINTCTPPPLFLGEIEYHSNRWFKINLVKEIVFKVNENYQDCMGYLFFLEKR
jgi:SAM-dependent methyltransferase